MYIEQNDRAGRSIWNYATCHKSPDIWAGKGAKPDHIIQLNCGEVHTHAKYETTRTWENFNNQGTKVTLLSNELWLIANNSKGFANRSKSMIRNLGLCKHSEIYLI